MYRKQKKDDLSKVVLVSLREISYVDYSATTAESPVQTVESAQHFVESAQHFVVSAQTAVVSFAQHFAESSATFSCVALPAQATNIAATAAIANTFFIF